MKRTEKLFAGIVIFLFVFSLFAAFTVNAVIAKEHKHTHKKGEECKDCGNGCKGCSHKGLMARPSLIIIHTNDFHGNLKDFKYKKIDKNNTIGGSAWIAAKINSYRKVFPGKVLLLDAGDMAQGTPISNLFEGQSVIEVMNHMKYDAATLGNHEFDWGQTALKNMVNEAKFPYVCANVVRTDIPGKLITGVKPYIIKEVNGYKIGILGLISPETPSISAKKNVAGLKFLDPEMTARKYIPKMRADGANVVVVLSHMGFKDDIKLAEKVRGIDVIVGGHSHTKNRDTKKVRNTLIVQADSKGRHIGVLTLIIDPVTKEIKYHTTKNEMIPLTHNNITPDPEVRKIINKYESKIKGKMGKVIAKTDYDLVKTPEAGRGDSNLGNLICDSMKTAGNADVALYNRGGIRAEIYKGDITVEDMFKVLPFDNTLVTFMLPGSALKAALEHGNNGSGSVQVSGVTFDVDYSKPAGSRVSNVKVNGADLQPHAMYKVATVDFIYFGGDKYNFKEGKNPEFGEEARSIFQNYVIDMESVKVPTEARINVIGK